LGESDSNQRAMEAVERAINNPLLDVNITNATGALINVVGGDDLSLEEYKQVVEYIGEKISPEAKIIAGAQISKDLENSIKVMVIITGVKSSQMVGEKISHARAKQDEMESELGIEFIDGEEEN
jgi:cell division protein FtsZ